MDRLHVGAAALNQTPLDWDGNRRRMLMAIEAARAGGVSLLCLPELCISGYGCEDAFHSPGVQRMALEVLREIAEQTAGLVVSVGLPVFHRSGVFNAACLIADRRVLGFTAKQALAGDGLHYEPRWFRPWPAGVRSVLDVGGVEHPLGDLHYDCGGVRIGFEICEDAWTADRPGRRLARSAIDVILNPSASHFAFDKHELRRRIVQESSRAFGAVYVYGNLLGNEAGRAIYGGEVLVAEGGELVAEGRRFGFGDVELTSAVVDLDLARMRRGQIAGAVFEPGALEGEVVADFEWPDPGAAPPPPAVPAWARGAHRKEEEFTRAVCLALFDYLRKSGCHGCVVSLSGGADSTAVACLVALMVRLGCAELGPGGFRKRLLGAGCTGGAGTSEGELVRRLLTCVYQATANSSAATADAARAVAEALGAEHVELDVEPLVRAYVELVEPAWGRPLDWASDDVALQNIQARVRAPGVWMLANLKNALLLATSNRSEAAVGYATMDGDTCGGLSPIAGIDKAFLRRWLRWLERTGPAGHGPVPELAAVNQLEPTAELRPAGHGQRDEDDLMPYELLDEIERAAIRDKRTPLEVLELVGREHPEVERDRLAGWVERFFRLWCRNQWKRERYAPSFHVDDENLDPKTWCRFPILSGGYERELRAMRAEL